MLVLFFRKEDFMGRYIKKIKKEIDNKEKYSFISEEELEQLKNRGIELKGLVDESLRNKDFKSARDYSIELAEIIKKLRKYKKYAKKN